MKVWLQRVFTGTTIPFVFPTWSNYDWRTLYFIRTETMRFQQVHYVIIERFHDKFLFLKIEWRRRPMRISANCRSFRWVASLFNQASITRGANFTDELCRRIFFIEQPVLIAQLEEEPIVRRRSVTLEHRVKVHSKPASCFKHVYCALESKWAPKMMKWFGT